METYVIGGGAHPSGVVGGRAGPADDIEIFDDVLDAIGRRIDAIKEIAPYVYVVKTTAKVIGRIAAEYLAPLHSATDDGFPYFTVSEYLRFREAVEEIQSRSRRGSRNGSVVLGLSFWGADP